MTDTKKPKLTFAEKQIETISAAISKLEGKSGEAQQKARERFDVRILKLKQAQDEACAMAASKFKASIEVLEKQLKALGGSR